MNTATSLATPRAAGPTGKIYNKTKTWFVVTSKNLGRMNETQPMSDNFIKIRNTSATTVENSGMIDEPFKPIVSIVGEAATRPKRIDARCNMSGETYRPTVGRIETGLLAH